MRFRPSAWKKRSRNSDKVNHQKADARVPAFFREGKIRFFTESWGANKGLGEAPKSCTRKEHESATDSIARRGQGAIAPCRVKGQRPLWGLGQRPNSSTGDQYAKRAQQRCRQRSVPASNSALPQERPQAALPQDSVKNRKNPHEKNRHVPPLDADVPVLVLGIVCPSDTTCYFANLSGGGASHHPPFPALPPVRC